MNPCVFCGGLECESEVCAEFDAHAEHMYDVGCEWAEDAAREEACGYDIDRESEDDVAGAA